MDTRRIRRVERRRAHRFASLVVATALLCVALGMVLPRSSPATVALIVVALSWLAFVALTDERIAPLHGLHRVVRLPVFTSIGATVASFRSRLAGSVRAVAGARLRPNAVVLDECDDDAAAWWGPHAAPPVQPVPPSVSSPPLQPEPPVAALPAPVVAAPVSSARVPAEGRVRHRARQLLIDGQLWTERIGARVMRRRADRDDAAPGRSTAGAV